MSAGAGAGFYFNSMPGYSATTTLGPAFGSLAGPIAAVPLFIWNALYDPKYTPEGMLARLKAYGNLTDQELQWVNESGWRDEFMNLSDNERAQILSSYDSTSPFTESSWISNVMEGNAPHIYDPSLAADFSTTVTAPMPTTPPAVPPVVPPVVPPPTTPPPPPTQVTPPGTGSVVDIQPEIDPITGQPKFTANVDATTGVPNFTPEDLGFLEQALPVAANPWTDLFAPQTVQPTFSTDVVSRADIPTAPAPIPPLPPTATTPSPRTPVYTPRGGPPVFSTDVYAPPEITNPWTEIFAPRPPVPPPPMGPVTPIPSPTPTTLPPANIPPVEVPPVSAATTTQVPKIPDIDIAALGKMMIGGQGAPYPGQHAPVVGEKAQFQSPFAVPSALRDKLLPLLMLMRGGR